MCRHHTRVHVLPAVKSPLAATAMTLGLLATAVAQDLSLERIEGATPRNVVFILSDDHRYDAMGFAGHPFLETPHMDSMAAHGVFLKNAFVTTSLCPPTRKPTRPPTTEASHVG